MYFFSSVWYKFRNSICACVHHTSRNVLELHLRMNDLEHVLNVLAVVGVDVVVDECANISWTQSAPP